MSRFFPWTTAPSPLSSPSAQEARAHSARSRARFGLFAMKSAIADEPEPPEPRSAESAESAGSTLSDASPSSSSTPSSLRFQASLDAINTRRMSSPHSPSPIRTQSRLHMHPHFKDKILGMTSVDDRVRNQQEAAQTAKEAADLERRQKIALKAKKQAWRPKSYDMIDSEVESKPSGVCRHCQAPVYWISSQNLRSGSFTCTNGCDNGQEMVSLSFAGNKTKEEGFFEARADDPSEYTLEAADPSQYRNEDIERARLEDAAFTHVGGSRQMQYAHMASSRTAAQLSLDMRTAINGEQDANRLNVNRCTTQLIESKKYHLHFSEEGISRIKKVVETDRRHWFEHRQYCQREDCEFHMDSAQYNAFVIYSVDQQLADMVDALEGKSSSQQSELCMQQGITSTIKDLSDLRTRTVQSINLSGIYHMMMNNGRRMILAWRKGVSGPECMPCCSTPRTSAQSNDETPLAYAIRMCLHTEAEELNTNLFAKFGRHLNDEESNKLSEHMATMAQLDYEAQEDYERHVGAQCGSTQGPGRAEAASPMEGANFHIGAVRDALPRPHSPTKRTRTAVTTLNDHNAMNAQSNLYSSFQTIHSSKDEETHSLSSSSASPSFNTRMRCASALTTSSASPSMTANRMIAPMGTFPSAGYPMVSNPSNLSMSSVQSSSQHSEDGHELAESSSAAYSLLSLDCNEKERQDALNVMTDWKRYTFQRCKINSALRKLLHEFIPVDGWHEDNINQVISLGMAILRKNLKVSTAQINAESHLTCMALVYAVHTIHENDKSEKSKRARENLCQTSPNANLMNNTFWVQWCSQNNMPHSQVKERMEEILQFAGIPVSST